MNYPVKHILIIGAGCFLKKNMAVYMRFSWNTDLSEVGGLSFYVMFIVIIAVSVVIHELLHGIGWAISNNRRKSIY